MVKDKATFTIAIKYEINVWDYDRPHQILGVTRVRTHIRKRAFSIAGPVAWNERQSLLHICTILTFFFTVLMYLCVIYRFL